MAAYNKRQNTSGSVRKFANENQRQKPKHQNYSLDPDYITSLN